MIDLTPSPLQEAEYDEESPYFFRRLGEICLGLGTNVNGGPDFKGIGNRLAVAKRHGVVLFSEGPAFYVVKSTSLLQHLQKWDDSDKHLSLTPFATAEARRVVEQGSVDMIKISPDASMVAVFCSSVNVIKVYAVKDLINSDARTSPVALRTIPTESLLLDLDWYPSAAPPPHVSTDLIAVLSSGSVLTIQLEDGGIATDAAFPQSASISWHPSGALVACGSGDSVVFCVWLKDESSWKSVAKVKVRSQDVPEDQQGTDLVVEAVRWVSPTCLLVCSRLAEDGQLIDTSPCCTLSWETPPHQRLMETPWTGGKDASPDTIEFFPCYLSQSSETARPMSIVAGHHLSLTTVEEWNLSLFAHALSSDDHLKLVECGRDGRRASPRGITISDDRLAIRIPNATGDKDNYIVGLGLDQTQVPAYSAGELHPTDPTAPNLPEQPVLWVLTSDNVMRAYIFGRLNEKGAVASAIKPTLQVPAPGVTTPAVSSAAAGQGLGALEAVAASTGLPDEESDFEEEESLAKEDESKHTSQPPVEVPATPVERREEKLDSTFEQTTQQVSQQVAAPTIVPAPVLQLQTGGSFESVHTDGTTSALGEVDEAVLKKIAAIERDFAGSLEESRALEASIHDGLKSIAEGWFANIENIRSKINDLSEQLQVVKSELAGDKGAVSDDGQLLSAQRFKEIYVRLDAMPGFKHPMQSQLQRAMDLEREKPLDPFLSAVKEETQAQVKVLVRKIAEVKECLMVLEDTVNTHRLSKAGHTTAYYRQREGNKVKTLSEAIQSQTTLIDRLSQQLDGMKACCDGMLPFESTDSLSLKGLKEALPSRHGPDSPLLHLDPHLVRPRWTSAKKVAFHTPASPSQRATPRGVGAPYTSKPKLKPSSVIVEKLQDRILKACRSVDGGLRVTRLPTALPPSPWRSDDDTLKKKTSAVPSPAARRLPPLSPFKLPDLPPPPYFPSPPPKPAQPRPVPVVQKPKVAVKEFIPSKPSNTSDVVNKGTQPPLPTTSQMKAATALSARALAAQPSTAKKGAQPPLPTKSQTEAAKSLMDKANEPAIPSQKGTTLSALSFDRQASFSSSSAATGVSFTSLSFGSGASFASGLAPSPQSSAVSFGPSSFGTASAVAVSSPASASRTSSMTAFGLQSSAATVSPVGKGQSVGPFSASSSSSNPSEISSVQQTVSSSFGFFGASTPSAASSSPFGQSSGFGQPATFGASTLSAASSSPFGQSSGFGQPAAFGFSGASTPSAASSSPFGQSSGFGQPAAFGFSGASTPSAASSSPFGQSSGFGQPAAFGQSGASTPFGHASSGASGFSAFASTQPSGFSAFAGQGGGFSAVGAGAPVLGSSPAPAKPPSSAMWQPRK